MSAPDIHDIAAIIWPTICKASEFGGPPNGAAHPSYTRYGNSDAETESRNCALKVQALIDEAVAREREACAQIVQSLAHPDNTMYSYGAAHVAATIRARGQG